MTSCTDPLAFDDDELFQYIPGGETLQEGRLLHLTQCSICQQNLTDYLHTHELLRLLYRSQCPDALSLSLYGDEMLSRQENAAIKTHLTTCLRCSDEVQLVQQELARFTPPARRSEFSLRQILKKSQYVLATLMLQPQVAIRQSETSPGPSTAWPRYYQSPALTVSLHLSYTSDHQLMLVGICICDDEGQSNAIRDAAVDLYRERDGYISLTQLSTTTLSVEQPFASTTVDHLGHFSFAPLQSGQYTLVLHLPDTEVVIEQINLD